ncbi:response regulator [Leisingera sp.]|uniref:response regulator n=1 Tax=Leisingera sp. TaxID=1879318 RepID=UPI002B276DA6|nr:response regulator [Leisingera sp.]
MAKREQPLSGEEDGFARAEGLAGKGRQLEMAAQAAGIGLFLVDFEAGITVLSGGVPGMFTSKTGKACSSFDAWMDGLVSADRAAMDEALAAASAPGSSGRLIAEVHSGGSNPRPVLILGQVHFTGSGDSREPSRVSGAMLDQSGEGLVQEMLSKRQGLETIGRFAGVIAHDFNNLLTVILANLEMAAFKTRDEDARGLLRRAAEAAEMGAGFNKRLLALAGVGRSAPVVIAVNRHITGNWQILERLLSEHTRLTFHPCADAWPVTADPSELDGAILNLIANARDAVADGGGVAIATENVCLTPEQVAGMSGAAPGEFVRISVSDTGSGMPASVAAQALEPFFTTKPTGSGSGLGLTSVGMTVARAGGFLQLETAPGEGTSVSLYLPRAPEAAECLGGDQDGEVPFGDGQLVLVVEDDPLVREAVLQRLEVLGYAVIEAADGEAALELLQQGEPVDLVFSDVVMPGRLSGYDLALLLRRRHPGIAVLLTSGYASRGVSRQRQLTSPVELIAKPYSLQVLARAVERALAGAGQGGR